MFLAIGAGFCCFVFSMGNQFHIDISNEYGALNEGVGSILSTATQSQGESVFFGISVISAVTVDKLATLDEDCQFNVVVGQFVGIFSGVDSGEGSECLSIFAVNVGKAEVEREFKKIYKQISDAEMTEIVTTIAKRVGINNADDFYNTIGFGGISLTRFLPKIKEEIEKLRAEDEGPLTTEDELAKVKLTNVSKRTRKSGGVIIDGDSGYAVKFAKCCNPLPGDRIVGFVTRGFGVSVHKADCPNVIASRGNEDNLARWVRAEWEQIESSVSPLYEAMIQIIAEDGIGVLAGISMALADMKVSISQINTQPDKNGEIAINIVVGCRNVSHYDSIVSRLRSLPKILSVRRGFMN